MAARHELRLLWARRARSRAGGFRLSLGDERAELARDVSDLRLWHRGAAPEISAEARERRIRRLLRIDRARFRFRSRRHDDARERRAGRLRLNGAKMWITNSPIADVAVVWAKTGRHHPRLHRRARHEGIFHAQDRRQVLVARQRHRRDRARGLLRAGGKSAAECAGDFGPVRLPQPRALRHFLGRDGGGGILLACGAAIYAGPQAVRPPAGRQPADPEKARRHADGDHARACWARCGSGA
jgi:hypothetical protein